MKLSTIAKTSLALGILTTGVMTTYAQSADAANLSNKFQNEGINILSHDIQNLLAYYKSPHWNLSNVSGNRVDDKVNVIDRSVFTEVTLAGKDKENLKNKNLSDIDVFVVKEGTSKDAPNRTIGSITKPNEHKYNDYVVSPQLSIETTGDNFKVSESLENFKIYKEEISLKELDFKLRQTLIEKNRLYTNGKMNGKIVVKMQNKDENDKYTFELDKKLQDHRMGDVIDSRKIEKITVEL
ncbi:exotoxin beta-grasp domain-containing protein [Staphylococcus hyicus]|uniref:exotoxin beta-grasp domain-containing protein n=1 Tax=Staphylococcus hyicus TaxID=1284 RepID=UPI00208F5432|nr:superantigen-like protein [Staphylococcus hyicus]MCO4330167.1 superantigen-like protein [Staphylococcus hyicus]MCO4332723.1 superantigen-like protein [Staphylococcus hyicus]MCO4335163.1 superantigen-like protein [Staphylococcus hyicus]MCO4337429.1 superantigen-like protein [Staphylococcus hyicus]